MPGDNPSYDAVINGLASTLSSQDPVNTLTVAPSGSLNIVKNASLFITGSGISNNGIININQGDSNFASILRFDSANSLLSGSGSINLRGVGTTYNVASIVIGGNGPLTFTHGANHLIHGLGGIDGFNGGGIFVNNGTISADDPNGGSIQIGLSYYTSAPQNKNNGLIEAAGGGMILFSGIIDQTGGGTFLADGNGSIVQFGNGDQNHFSVVSGGGLNTSHNGLLRTTPDGNGVTLTGCTNDGAFQVPQSGLLIRGSGLTNNGTILVNPTDPANSTSLMRFDESGTWEAVAR